jgi:hypothetical protein
MAITAMLAVLLSACSMSHVGSDGMQLANKGVSESATTTLTTAQVRAQKLRPQVSSDTPNDFVVVFDGIICDASFKLPSGKDERRAIVVESSPFAMHHEPSLLVPTPSDPAASRLLQTKLRDASHNVVKCNADYCSVALGDVSLRIRSAANGTKALGSLVPAASMCLVPHLQKEAHAGALVASVMNDGLPSDNAAAYFEIEGGGTLAATAFKQPGLFFTIDPSTGNRIRDTCRRFASAIEWSGTTDSAAMLQMASDATLGGWVTIPTGNTGRLEVIVTNQPPAGTPPSPAHFSLNHKLMTGDLPQIETPCTLDASYTCKECSGCLGPLVFVPGCSDTTYP